MDLIFAFDLSEHITESDFQSVIKVVRSFTEATNVDAGKVRIGLLSYDQFIVHLNIYSSNKDVSNAIMNMKKPTQRFSDGLSYLRNVMLTPYFGDRENVSNLVIIITDGQAGFTTSILKEGIKDVKSDGTQIMLLGIGIPERMTQEFYNVADYTATDNALIVNDFDNLHLNLDVLYKDVCMGKTGVTVLCLL